MQILKIFKNLGELTHITQIPHGIAFCARKITANITGEVIYKTVAILAVLDNHFADIPKPVNPEERVYHPVPDNEKPIVSIVTDPEEVSTRVTLYLKHEIVPTEIRPTQTGLLISLAKSMASHSVVFPSLPWPTTATLRIYFAE